LNVTALKPAVGRTGRVGNVEISFWVDPI